MNVLNNTLNRILPNIVERTVTAGGINNGDIHDNNDDHQFQAENDIRNGNDDDNLEAESSLRNGKKNIRKETIIKFGQLIFLNSFLYFSCNMIRFIGFIFLLTFLANSPPLNDSQSSIADEGLNHDRDEEDYFVSKLVIKSIEYYKAPEGHGFHEKNKRYKSDEEGYVSIH